MTPQEKITKLKEPIQRLANTLLVPRRKPKTQWEKGYAAGLRIVHYDISEAYNIIYKEIRDVKRSCNND